MIPCPSLDQLQNLLRDELAAPETETVEAHVETCLHCQQALEQLIAAPGERSSAASAHRDGATGHSGRDFLRQLENQLPTGAWDAPHRAAGPDSATGRPPDRSGGDTTVSVPAATGYQLLGELGRGGMGVVYRGRDADLSRTLAVKVLLEKHAGNAELRRRFLDEAQIMGQLQHPGVAPIHQVGRLPDGRPFFTMKQIEGQTLAEMLKDRESRIEDRERTSLDPRLLAIFEQVCQTVAFAHSRGILHRDLKPHNVMVGAFGEVQVMDWGLAKQMQNDERGTMNEMQASAVHHSSFMVHRSAQTAAGSIMGTPAYMAPEQARGELDNLDPRSDVFGLGAILCEILTGEPAFATASAVENRKVAAKGDLSDAFARLDQCGADAELIQLAKKCLAPAKEDRPRDAARVAQAVAQYQADVQRRLKETEIQRASVQAKLIEQIKRRRLRVALVALSFLFVVAAAVAGVWYVNNQAEREIAESALQARRTYLNQEVGRALKEAGAARQELHVLLDNPRKVHVVLGDLSKWHKPVEDARGLLNQARKLADSDPELLDSDLAGQLKQLEDQLAVDDRALELAETLDGIRQEASIPVDGKLNWAKLDTKYAEAFARDNLEVAKGSVAQVVGQVKASPARYAIVAALDHWADVTPDDNLWKRLLELARQVDPDPWRNQVRDPNNWKSLSALENLAHQAEIDKQSPQVLILLGKRLQSHGGNSVALLEQAVLTYGQDFWLHFHLGEIARDPVHQAGYYRAALALRPGSSAAMYNLGMSLYLAKNTDGAIACWKKAIDLDGKFAEAFSNLGLALLEKRELDGAMSYLKTALKLDRKNAHALLNMGLVLHLKKDLVGAIACCEEALKIDPKFAKAHNNLGLALQAKGEVDGAIACYKTAIGLKKKDYAEPHNNLGTALYAKKDLEGAIACFRKALELKRDNAHAHSNMGMALLDKGDVDGAIACCEEALKIDPKFAKAHDNLGLALKNKDLNGAIDCWKKAIECDPEFAPPHNNLGIALTIKGDRDGGFACFQKAVKLDSKYVPALSNLGEALRLKKDFDGAITWFQKALALDPKYIPAHFNLGLVLIAKKDFEGAKKSFAQVLKLLPPSDPARVQAQKLMQYCEHKLNQERLRP
jgi:tetratricopeptide (TPR) repeat protein/serine/threonine protein kinase